MDEGSFNLGSVCRFSNLRAKLQKKHVDPYINMSVSLHVLLHTGRRLVGDQSVKIRSQNQTKSNQRDKTPKII
jgi:hypothetical protein